MRGPARWLISPPGMCIVPGYSGVASARLASPRSNALSRRSWARNPIVPRAACSLSPTMAPPIVGRGRLIALRAKWPNVVLVHTPIHASWLNQIEVYFSIVQRKLLTPSDFLRPRCAQAGPDGFPKPLSESREAIQMDFHAPRSSRTHRQTPVTQRLVTLTSAGKCVTVFTIGFLPFRKSTTRAASAPPASAWFKSGIPCGPSHVLALGIAAIVARTISRCPSIAAAKMSIRAPRSSRYRAISRRPICAAAPRPVSQSPAPQSHAALINAGSRSSRSRTRENRYGRC